MHTTSLVPSLLAGILVAFALHWLLRRGRLPLDTPNERSLHSSPLPRSGGLVVLPAILLAWLLVPESPPAVLLGAVAVLFLLSLLDDVRSLPVVVRLACHLAAAALVALSMLGLHLGWLGVLVAAVAIGWMTNLYNFMDGSDGLAGGMALIGFAVYGLASWIGGDTALASACFAVAAAAAGFLVHNFHPARIFLGDAGSIPLGFLAGSLGLLGWVRELWPPWFPLLVFSPFVVDASATLARRLLRGERVWQAHREHYYQRLVRSGWGHRRTALVEYALMAGCGLAALAGMDRAPAIQAVLLLVVACAYAFLMLLVDRAWGRHSRVFGQAAQREG